MALLPFLALFFGVLLLACLGATRAKKNPGHDSGATD